MAVVRPDGYVGTIAHLDDLVKIKSYLTRCLQSTECVADKGLRGLSTSKTICSHGIKTFRFKYQNLHHVAALCLADPATRPLDGRN